MSTGGLDDAEAQLISGGLRMVSTLMLLGAILASLALGVLVAYGICLSMFSAFRFHAVSVSKSNMSSNAMRAVES